MIAAGKGDYGEEIQKGHAEDRQSLYLFILCSSTFFCSFNSV